MSWRYLAVDIDAYAGVQRVIDGDLPMSDVSITRSKNAGQELTGTIAAPPSRLFDEYGDPLIRPWRTAIFADDGDRLYGGIVAEGSDLESDEWSIETIGFADYPNGQPAQGSWSATNIDAFDAFRKAWSDLQALPGGKLGVLVDQHASGVKIGKKVAQGTFDTVNGPLSFEYEPVQLRWYETNDVGQWIADLAENVGFDFWEEHEIDDADELVHRIRLAYPRLGRVRRDVRFEAGRNIRRPELARTEYASGVIALGAGEGSAMIRGESHRSGEDRIRRVALSDEKTARTRAAAATAARAEMRVRAGAPTTESVVASGDGVDELRSVDLGDRILLVAPQGDQPDSQIVDFWVTVDQITIRPNQQDELEFAVIRSDTMMS